jgi:hypothetical protein
LTCSLWTEIIHFNITSIKEMNVNIYYLKYFADKIKFYNSKLSKYTNEFPYRVYIYGLLSQIDQYLYVNEKLKQSAGIIIKI